MHFEHLLALLLAATLLSGCQASESVELNDSNWLERLGENRTWLVKFLAPWCPACQRLQPAWKLLAQRAGEVDGLRVGHVDVAKEEVLGGLFLITQLPTVYLYTPDGSFRLFDPSSARAAGSNDHQLVSVWLNFARPNGGHDGVAPLPWYRSPTSPHVRCMGWLIRGALSVRDLHSRLTGPAIGMSAHLAYLVILCAAVAAGAGLVLCLVCLCDRFCPEVAPDEDQPALATAPAAAAAAAAGGGGKLNRASGASGDSKDDGTDGLESLRRRLVASAAADEDRAGEEL